MKYVMIPENEYQYNKNIKDSYFSPKEVQELIEYKDVFIKFLKNATTSLRIELADMKHVGEETKVYNYINQTGILISSIEETSKSFTMYVNEQEKKKDEKKTK